MSSSVIAARDMDHLLHLAEDAKVQGKLLVLEFIGSKNYVSTCQFMKPFVESIADNCKKNNVKADFCTVDADNKKFKDLVENFEVQVLPTFWMILNYVGYEGIIGTDKEKLNESIKKYVPKN